MNQSRLLALSIRQPWADLIVDGIKDIENRKWNTRHRGSILIHSPKTVDTAAVRRMISELSLSAASDYKPITGAIIGAVRITDCVQGHSSRFFGGPWGFVLADAVRFPTPIKCSGKLGLFPIPLEVAEEISRAYEGI
ncbi:MAG: ASCH domain-containing protein [bacterium]|nr:ASCH domain-containing protein [bacterium]